MRILALVLVFSLCGCLSGRLSVDEIHNVSQKQLEPLRLQPSYEMNDLRYDVIRQTHESWLVDSNCSEEDVEYHPMGFDLGNGLFIDMNYNIAIRVDQLLDIDRGEDYRIRRTSSNGNNVTYRSKEQNEVCRSFKPLLQKEQHVCFRQEQNGNEVVMRRNGRIRYSITNDRREMTYSRGPKKRFQRSIRQLTPGTFVAEMRGGRREFSLSNDNVLTLGRRYRIKINESDQHVEIYRQRRIAGDLLLKRIKIGKDKFFVYNDNTLRGYKVEKEQNKLTITRARRNFLELERLN